MDGWMDGWMGAQTILKGTKEMDAMTFRSIVILLAATFTYINGTLILREPFMGPCTWSPSVWEQLLVHLFFDTLVEVSAHSLFSGLRESPLWRLRGVKSFWM